MSMILSNSLSNYSDKFVYVSKFNSYQYKSQNDTIMGGNICNKMKSIEMYFNYVYETYQKFDDLIGFYNVLFETCHGIIQDAMDNPKFKSILDQLIVLHIASSDGKMSSVNWFNMFCKVISDASNGNIIIVKETQKYREFITIQYNVGFMQLNSSEDIICILNTVIETLANLYETLQHIVELLEIALGNCTSSSK